MKRLRELKFAKSGSLLLFTFPICLFLPLSILGQDITPTSPAFERRDQPVTREDLLILEKADKILSDETKWNRKDDRTCRPEDKTWSLFCALQKASIEVLGKYDHRRVALQEVRFIIEDLLKGKEYEHRLMEYNNLPTTQFSDIKKVLKQAADKVAARLSKQNQAATRIPNFDNAIPLEEKAETTANANIGDLDGDGDPDIVLAKGRHWPLVDLVLLNDGKGHFDRRYPVSDKADRSYTAALVDLDGNGTLDLVVGNDTPDEKVIYFNDGKGQFRWASTFGEAKWETRNVTVIDLNRDKRPDIVVANRGGNQNQSVNVICLNDGKGGFPGCRPLSSESATTIATGDLNGDGMPDVLVPHRDEGQSYIFVNDGKGGFVEKHSFGPAKSSTRAIALGDLNGDGRLDVVIGDETGGGGFIYFNQGHLKFSEALPIAEKTDTFYSTAIADMNGDGHADVVIGNEKTPGIVLINDGSGRGFRSIRFGDGKGAVYGMAIGDVNGDGSPDIVAARSDAVSMLYFNSLKTAVAQKHGVILNDVPQQIDATKRYLFYLHGKIVEQDRRPTSPQYGVYEYDQILDSFKAGGFVVISEQRKKDTDVEQYAKKLAGQVKQLLDAKVPPERITVVGASQGSWIAMLSSTYLQNRGVNFVFIAACSANDAFLDAINLHGNVLSIYERSDLAQSCQKYHADATGIGAWKEVELNTGLKHGFIYRPMKEWIEPTVAWAQR